MNIPDCRFIYIRDAIYPADYIGILDISLEAHNVLCDAGVFSFGRLINMDENAVASLPKITKKITEELLAFIRAEGFNTPSIGAVKKVLNPECNTTFETIKKHNNL